MPVVGTDHGREELLRGEEVRHKVDVDGPAQRRLLLVDNGGRQGDAGVVDEDGRVAHLTPHLGRDLAHGVPRCHIELVEDGVGRVGPLWHAYVGSDHLDATAREASGDSLA
jgi:hypothetical protein